MSSLIPYAPGMDYGVGINSLNGDIKGDAVLRSQPDGVTNTEGSTQYYSLKRIESAEELEKELAISTEAQAKGGIGFISGSGSTRVDFTRQVSINSYSVFMTLKVTVEKSFRRMRDVSLKPEVSAIAAEGNIDRFYEMYGDSFVLGVQSGGVFIGIIEIRTSSESEKRKISTEVDLKIGGWLGSLRVSNDVRNEVREFSENRSLRIICFIEGGNSNLSLPGGIDEMFQRALDFPSEVEKFGKPYSALVQDYRALNLPSPNQIDLDFKNEFLQRIRSQYNALLNIFNDVNFVLNNQNQFRDLNEAKVKSLNEARSKVSGSLNALMDSASRCARYFGECRFPENIEIPLIDLPKREEHPIYWKASSLKGFLNEPASNELKIASDGLGRYMNYKSSSFELPSIYWSPRTGAYLTRGGIGKTWREYGAESGELGYPISDHSPGFDSPQFDGKVFFQDFENGTIFWTPLAAPSIVLKPIADKWLEMGGFSFFGYPTVKGMSKKLVDGGLSHEFQGRTVTGDRLVTRTIYFWPETGAFYSTGGIEKLWIQNGSFYPQGPGYPTSDHSLPSKDGTFRQDFQRAIIHWPARIEWK